MNNPPNLEILKKLKFDFPYFARNALQVKDKSGKLVAFDLNRSQMFVHERLEAQRKRTGKVRAIILKARQVGCSTYIQGRFYHKICYASQQSSPQAFIMTHASDSTNALFSMTKNFAECHSVIGKPTIDTSNAKELKFMENKGSYKIGTAGAKEVGRGMNNQYLHLSEVAFWENGASHVSALMQTVGDDPGTEIIIESTANGMGNLFYDLTMSAIDNKNNFEVIFMPWFWYEGYATVPPKGWHNNIPHAWQDYGAQFQLNYAQLYWAFEKNAIMAASIGASYDEPCWTFRQEYPCTLAEAFVSSGNSYIPPHLVAKARKPEEEVLPNGPLIIGVDPSRNKDKTGIISRRGRRMGKEICIRLDPEGSTEYVSQYVAQLIRDWNPKMVNIDVTGVGAGVYDNLLAWGHGHCINAVNFATKSSIRNPDGSPKYANKRAEMYGEMLEWFNQDMPVQIPDDDTLQADICAPEWGNGKTSFTTNGSLQLESKDKIQERLKRSPDLGDAAALCFAVPIESMMSFNNSPVAITRGKPKNSMTGY